MVWVFAIGLIGALVGGYAYVGYLDRKRREKIVSLVKELGLELNWQVPDSDLARFNRFPIASKGRMPRTETTIIADDGETRMVIFDFSYTTGHGKHKRAHLYSIAMCSNGMLNLPVISLEPETWQSKLAEFVGHKDIDIEDDPVFSSQFCVGGENESEIKKYLTATRRATFAKFPNKRFAGQSDTLLVIHKQSKLTANNLRTIMTEALQVTRGLLED